MGALSNEFKARRQANAKAIERSQRATAAAILDFHAVRKQPVPYAPTVDTPVLEWIVPSDEHLVPTGEVMRERRPKPPIAQPPSPPRMPPAAAADEEPPSSPVDTDTLVTLHNEWTLQKNAYDPDIAARLRIDVRKSAALALSVGKPVAEIPNQSSTNLYYVFGSKVPPPDPELTIDLDAVFPKREVNDQL